MGTIVGPLIQAMHIDGTSQYAWRANPSFKNASAGGVSIWVRANSLLSSAGTTGIVTMADSAGGAKKFMSFDLRRNSGFPSSTSTYIGITDYHTGTGVGVYGYSPTAISASVWINAVFGSDGNLYINGSLQTLISPSGLLLGAGWYNSISAGNKDFAIGARRLAGVASSFSAIDIMNVNYLPGRSFTSTEAAEIYAAKKCAPPSSLSMYASLAPIYTFNGNTNDLLNVENLTAVASPTYISP